MKKKRTYEELLEDLIGHPIYESNLSGVEKAKLEVVLEKAYDIRKFELEMYWKRATYFWGFIAVAYTAFFIVSNTKNEINKDYQFMVVCIGLTFSFAWYLVNRGSTYWVTNYERIIDAIEEKLGCEFYKLNLMPEYSKYNLQQNYPFSVSRINIKVSLFILFTWLLLFVRAIHQQLQSSHPSNFFIATTIATVWMLWYLLKSKSSLTNRYQFEKRESHYKT